jgi:hypothetical protein
VFALLYPKQGYDTNGAVGQPLISQNGLDFFRDGFGLAVIAVSRVASAVWHKISTNGGSMRSDAFGMRSGAKAYL